GLLARHHAGQEVEGVALDDLAAVARALQPAPVDVVLLRQASRKRGAVGPAHSSPPARGGLAPAGRMLRVTRVYRTDSSRPGEPYSAINPTRKASFCSAFSAIAGAATGVGPRPPPPAAAAVPTRPQGRQAWKKTPSM